MITSRISYDLSILRKIQFTIDFIGIMVYIILIHKQKETFPMSVLDFFKNDKEFKLTKETTMGEMLEYDGAIAYILMECGMHCIGCPSSIGESLEEACIVHGLDPDFVMAKIQDYLDDCGVGGEA